MFLHCIQTNIPHKEGIEACRHFLKTRPHKSLPTERIYDLIRMILGMNNFSFLINDQRLPANSWDRYGDTNSTVACKLINLLMGNLEQQAPIPLKNFLPSCSSAPLTISLINAAMNVSTFCNHEDTVAAFSKKKTVVYATFHVKKLLNHEHRTTTQTEPFVITYIPALSNVSTIVRKIINILQSSTRCN